MAGVYRETSRGRDGYRLKFRGIDQKQKSVWLGKMSKRSADTVLRHVRELIHAAKVGVKPEAATVQWAQGLEGRIRDRLVEAGLITGEAAERRERSHTLARFVDLYIEERTDAKPSTLTNYRHAKQWLVDYFGADKLLTDITPADCDRLQRHLLQNLAASTAEKILKRSKTMLRHAVRDRLLEENPFDDLKIGASVNRERDAFIDDATAKRVLRVCPDETWKAIFALARWGGLRTPSETLNLKWSDIDWKQNRIRIDSPKTGLRHCPLFPQLRLVLLAAKRGSNESPWVVNRYRSSSKNLRTRLRSIIEEAGLTPWPKLFVNLRASCRTELQEQFPDHVVNAWLGHSSRIAEKHYLQVTPDHWAKAAAEPDVNSRGNAGGNISANQQASTASAGGINAENPLPDGSGFPEILALAPPVGLEGITIAVARRWVIVVSTDCEMTC